MASWLTFLVIVGGSAFLSWPLGRYLAWAMDSHGAGVRRLKLETLFSSLAGAAGRESQDWRRYAGSMLVFNAAMAAICALILWAQPWLPLNPDGKGALSWDLIFNTTASFVTNTNLQHYSGEVSMSTFSQVFALMWLQFVSAATGLACLAALARGIGGSRVFGNFFIDLQRATFLVLLPAAALVAFLFLLGGMPMTLGGSVEAQTLEGATQTIARGPVAVFVAIKQLGTNGGGFFGPNSTHPFENPTFFTNLVSMVAIILLPMAAVWMFGRMSRRLGHAAVIFGAMLVLLAGKAAWAMHWEAKPAAALASFAVAQDAGNLEGKELRLGSTTGPLWSVLTTATSNGSVAAMHDSLNPLTGLAPLAGMWLNETFGGVGVGMINMFVYVVIAVFLAGMMIGRTPEYGGKRVEAREMTAAAVTLLCHPLLILGGAALFAVTPWGVDTIHNPGARGLTEILYEFSSAAANNGSGYEGLGDNTVPWNIATGLVMLLARFIPIVLPLAIAGWLAERKPVAASAGTLRTDTPTFGLVLLATIVLVGALTFLPVAVLGPVAEHLVAVP
ncbi:MAG: potassium-transporting ATPase subunit A [Opitutaceae bacterium]|nr:potassium-transporting ATPase subunit A [Opitutaceae bacterium]